MVSHMAVGFHKCFSEVNFGIMGQQELKGGTSTIML